MGNCVLAEVAAILERFIAVALLLTTVKVAKYLANLLILLMLHFDCCSLGL